MQKEHPQDRHSYFSVFFFYQLRQREYCIQQFLFGAQHLTYFISDTVRMWAISYLKLCVSSGEQIVGLCRREGRKERMVDVKIYRMHAFR